ncbi:hypothetical protein V6N13_051568 [Hibiscus sabdariffa]|uniref:Nuclear transcription factor Y subunit n=1 Tax=Hibiscus sabdariffa TaxID=183260 RepID=A0ABR2T4M8_9ROSI
MASRVRILPTIDENSLHSSSHLLASCLPWWNSNQLEAPSQHYHNSKHSVLQSPEHEPMSARMVNRSHRGPSGEDIEGQMKSVFFLTNPNTMLSPFHQNYDHSTAFVPFPYVDASFGGLLTSHIQHDIMTGAMSKRIPLPVDLADDEPIYVNAKQYHGILRRRQHRAKLEMQNKLVKSRKPYLHESRHLHALKRVRGSGGRFLSKKLQQPETISKNSHCILDISCLDRKTKRRSELESRHSHTVGYGGSSTSCSDMSSISNNGGDFQQPK